MTLLQPPDPLCPSPHPDGYALCINCSLIAVVRETIAQAINALTPVVSTGPDENFIFQDEAVAIARRVGRAEE